MTSKTVIIHCHIFKNGGATIDHILRKNFGSAAKSCESKDGKFLAEDNVLDFLKNIGNDEVSSISSHKLGLPAPKHNQIQFIPLVMIREPLDRLGSIYSFYNRLEKNISYECILAKQNTFKRFTQIIFESNMDSSIVNTQSRFFLANYSPACTPSDKTWGTIVENLNNISCFGLLEKFQDSIALWEDYLGNYFPGIDLSYSIKNSAPNRSSSLTNRLHLIKEELGESLVKEFEKRNKFDYMLYHLVKEKIDRITTSNYSKINTKYQRQPNDLICENRTNEKNIVYEKEKSIKTIICSGQCGKLKCPQIISGSEMALSGSVRIVACGLFDCNTSSILSLAKEGQRVEVVIVVEAINNIKMPIIGITVKNNTSAIMFSMNSYLSKNEIKAPNVGKATSYSFVFNMPPLNGGSYSITPAFASGTQENHVILSSVEDAFVFVVPRMSLYGLPGALYINNYKVQQN